MTLSTAYLLTGAAFVVPGAALASGAAPAYSALRAFPRSLPAAVVFFGGAAAWFLWGINNLSESDLAGFPRGLMLGIFGATALLSFKFLRDLLAVRGLGILLLLSARALLDIGYMQQPKNLLLSSLAYLFVVLGLLWGVSPHRFRDWLGWILERRTRALVSGIVFLALGAANVLAALLTK
jgi:hypothetical protein